MPSMRLQSASRPNGSGSSRARHLLLRYVTASVLGSAVLGSALMAPAGATAAAGAAPAAASAAAPAATWTTAPSAPSPPPLAYASAAYDADTSTVVLFGGMTAGGTLSNATWLWNGSGWSQAQPPHSPPARELASMAFDPTLHQLIVFGGQGSDGTLLGDTWAWNGATWIQVAQNATSPTGREAAAFAYDPSGNLLLFGGTGLAPGAAPTSSSTLGGAGSAPPPGPDTTLGDTWEWTAHGWAQATSTGPPARSGAALAYDQATGTTVLFGGESTPAASPLVKPLPDTWLWSHSGWVATKPASSPPPRFEALADADPSLGGPVVLTGEGTSGTLSDGWVWTGSRWLAVSIRGSAAPREGAAGAYDAADQTLLVFGGRGGGGATLSDTGLVRVTAPTRAPANTPGASTPTTAPARSGGTTTRPTTPPRNGPPTTTTPAPDKPRTPTTKTPVSTPSPTGGAVAEAGPPVIHAGRRTVTRGATVRLTGAGFAPGSVVVLTFHSAPALLGTVTAGADGTFTTSVSVPDGAAPGPHHIVADGTASSGASVAPATALMVTAPAHRGLSTAATLSLVGLALLIPVAAYLVMAIAGLWRRRRAAV